MDDLIYVITDRMAVQAPLAERVRLMLDGGLRLVQLREKDLDDAALLELAKSLKTVCLSYNSRLIINRNLKVALAAIADGLHVGFDEISDIQEIKQKAGSSFLVGVSTHSESEALAAQQAGADYISLGPVFETPSKKGMGNPLGPDEVGRISKLCRIPVFGLGGVFPEKIAEMKSRGIERVAMIRSVLAAADPASEVRNYLKLLREAS